MASLACQAINMTKQGGCRQRMVTVTPTMQQAQQMPIHSGYIMDTPWTHIHEHTLQHNTTQQLAASPVCAGWKFFHSSPVPVLQTLIPEGPTRVVNIQRHFHAQAMLLQQAADERLIA